MATLALSETSEWRDGKRLTESAKDYICSEYAKGSRHLDIAGVIGCSGVTIYNVLRDRGVRPNQKRAAPPIARTCPQCGSAFSRPDFAVFSKQVTCSDVCRKAYWRGQRWATSKRVMGIDSRGYVLMPRDGGKRRRFEHMVVAEKVLGRPLKADEVVHHINGDKADNRNENLLICTRAYHMALHARMGDLYMAEKFGRKV